MTEQRYSDGKLAKWYYSRSDVISDGNNEYYLKSKKSIINFNYEKLLGSNDLLDVLNQLTDENERLKRHIKRNTISRIRVEDVLGCARDSRFYENKEIITAIDGIAKDLGVDLE